MNIKGIVFSATLIAGAFTLAGAANAAPIGAGSLGAGIAPVEKNIVQVQMRRRVAPRVAPRAGAFRGGRGRVVVRRRGIGPAGAAAIGLGVLGAAAIAAGAANAAPAECWLERREVYDQWGYFRGYRNVRVCQ